MNNQYVSVKGFFEYRVLSINSIYTRYSMPVSIECQLTFSRCCSYIPNPYLGILRHGEMIMKTSRSNLLGTFMVSWTSHVRHIGGNCLNLIHKVISILPIVLLAKNERMKCTLLLYVL